MKDRKNMKSIGYRIGQVVATITLMCIAALIATAFIVPTVKIIIWAFSFI